MYINIISRKALKSIEMRAFFVLSTYTGTRKKSHINKFCKSYKKF